MNKKGFTLVELLGVLVILSIIMLIAVPNVISIMDKNKKDIFISDARKFVAAVQYELSKNSKYPTGGGSCYVTLSALNTIDIGESPNKENYNTNSYIIVTDDGTSYSYMIYFTDGVLNINGKFFSYLSRSDIGTGDISLTPSGSTCL